MSPKRNDSRDILEFYVIFFNKNSIQEKVFQFHLCRLFFEFGYFFVSVCPVVLMKCVIDFQISTDITLI